MWIKSYQSWNQTYNYTMLEYSVFIGASVICFDFTKPDKCQVNFKNNQSISLSLSLTHTHTHGGSRKK